MSATRVVLTAGHSRSLPSELLAELLRRDGVEVVGILVVRTVNVARFRALVQQRGLAAVVQRVRGVTRSVPFTGRAHTSPSVAALLPAHGIAPVGLPAWARARGVPCLAVPDLNAPASIAFVTRCGPDAVAYTGGGILRGPFLAAAGRVLNAHAGPLPAIRGMNAAEWAALLGEPPEVTVHLIDRGIDTGATLATFAYDRTVCATVAALREAAVATGVLGLREVITSGRFRSPGEPRTVPAGSRQCFIMAPALTALLEERLRTGGHIHG